MKVLLADDSRITRAHFVAVLVEAGHEVEDVEDGREAWAAFERAPVPLVILDWMMPGLDGLEVTRRIRDSPTGPATFVLMVTGRGTPTDVSNALAGGVDDFVIKPVATEYLRARVLIAEQRIAAAAAARANEEALRHARWLAGVGETALTLQHEINNPLLAVLLETELLATDPTVPPAAVERLRDVLVQANRIADVVRRISALKDPTVVHAKGDVRRLDISSRGDA